MHDLRKYRESIILVEHIEAILKVLDLTERSLLISELKQYIPVQNILSVISDQKAILQIHYEKAKETKKIKGKVIATIIPIK